MEEAFRRGLESIVGRWDGPMSLRLIIQPAMATFFAVRAGLADARNGRPPFLWAAFFSEGHRREALLQGWKDVGTVFIAAMIVDAVYQVIVHSGVYAVELLATAALLALLPYAVVRGLVTRVARRRPSVSHPVAPSQDERDRLGSHEGHGEEG